MLVREITDFLARKAPYHMKMDDEHWRDNVGLLVGVEESPVTRVLIALDITDQVIDEAADLGAELIVSHHPLFFSCKRVVDTDSSGRKIINLLRSGISAICMHTNLDVVEGGVNTALAETLGLMEPVVMERHGADEAGLAYGLGRIGRIREPVDFPAFLTHVKRALHANGLRYHDAGRAVEVVAVSGGSDGSNLQMLLAAGCDTLVTADIKYNKFLEAKELGLNLIDAGHFATENVVCPVMKAWLEAEYPELAVSLSVRHEQTDQFYS